MTPTEFENLLARCEPTKHPAVCQLLIKDYRSAINLLASFDPTSRNLAIEIHKKLLPGDARLKHLIGFQHSISLMFCGAFFRDPKRKGGQRHTFTLLLLLTESSGAQYAGTLAAEYRRQYHEV